MKALFLFLTCYLLFFLPAFSQETKTQAEQSVQTPGLGSEQQVEMADKMRADGKIYVVVAVISAIFAGLFIYLIFLDRKIGKLEKEIRNNVSNRV